MTPFCTSWESCVFVKAFGAFKDLAVNIADNKITSNLCPITIKPHYDKRAVISARAKFMGVHNHVLISGRAVRNAGVPLVKRRSVYNHRIL